MYVRLQVVALLLLCHACCMLHADSGVSPNAARLCYSCDGINCQRTTKQNATMQCTNVLDYCVTIFDELSVVAKGCYSEMPSELRRSCDEGNAAAAAAASCQKCFGQLCNTKGRADVKCITCSAAESSKCRANAAALTAEQCDAPTALNTYCYVRDTAKDGIRRGCALHQAEQLDCLADASCSLCLPSDASACNTYALSAESAAATLNGVQRWLIVAAILLPVALKAHTHTR